MPEYVKLVNGQPLQSIMADEKPEDIPHKNCIWLLVEIKDDGAFDPTTHIKERIDTQSVDKYTIEYKIRAKTVDELDADKERVLNDYDKVSFRILFNHENRIRALEGKASITAAQFRTAIKALL